MFLELFDPPKKWNFSIKNWMGPNPNGPPSKVLEMLDAQV